MRFKQLIEKFFAGVTPEQAEKMFLPINRDVIDSVESVKTGGRVHLQRLGGYQRVKRDCFDLLLDPGLKTEIDDYFKRLQEYNDLREKSNDVLADALEELPQRDYDDNQDDIKSAIYKALREEGFNLKSMHDITRISDKKSEQIRTAWEMKGGQLRKTITLQKQLIAKGERLSDKIIASFQNAANYHNNRESILTSLLVISTIIGVMISIYMAHITSEGISKSNELIERQRESLTPFLPEINFQGYGGKETVELRQEGLAKPLSFDKDGMIGDWEKERFVLLVYNAGTLNSGPINIEISNPRFHIPLEYISNINGTSEVPVEFNVWLEGCGQGNLPEKCNKSLVPLGIREFQINMTCSYCKKPLNTKFKACIYKSDREKECGLISN